MTSKTIAAGLALALAAGCSGAQNAAGTIPAAPAMPAATATASHGAPAAAAPNAAAVPDVVAVRPPLTGVRDLGRAPAKTPLTLAVTLRYRNEAALDQLLQQQRTPHARSYHAWLTSDQFDARFAPTKAQYDRVAAALRRAGFRITQTYANRTVIDATGTVRQAERYFDTEIHSVVQPHAGTRYVNVRDAYAPAAVRGLVLGVDGLDTRALVRTFNARVVPHTGTPMRAQSAASKLFGPVSSATGLDGYGPLGLSTAYDMPVRHSTGAGGTFDGTGRTTGIVIDADFQDSDLATYLQYFGVKRTGPATKRIALHGGPPPGDEAIDSLEATLDTEATVSNAPGTALDVYEIPSLQLNYITDAYNRVVSDNAVDVASSSFGGCEEAFAKTAQTWNAIAKQGAAEGITFSASTGDGGGSLCANAPASGPNFVAVGGTSLQVGPKGSWYGESAWDGSGGGVSTVFPTPAWQKGVAGINPRGRNEPDIALDANPQTGMAFYYDGSWNTSHNPVGGTSLASPLFAAIVTEIDQMKSGRIGLTSSKLFAVWKSSGYGSASAPYFHDVVQGSSGPYFASSGYDLVTGIGSLDAYNLEALL